MKKIINMLLVLTALLGLSACKKEKKEFNKYGNEVTEQEFFEAYNAKVNFSVANNFGIKTEGIKDYYSYEKGTNSYVESKLYQEVDLDKQMIYQEDIRTSSSGKGNKEYKMYLYKDENSNKLLYHYKGDNKSSIYMGSWNTVVKSETNILNYFNFYYSRFETPKFYVDGNTFTFVNKTVVQCKTYQITVTDNSFIAVYKSTNTNEQGEFVQETFEYLKLYFKDVNIKERKK